MTPDRYVLSFRSKLLLALVMLGAVAVALVCYVLLTIHVINMSRLAHAAMATQARVIAIHSEASLSFQDAAAGQETLAALRAEEGVVWAGLYGHTGQLFAAYARDGAAPPPSMVRALQVVEGPDGLFVVREDVQRDSQSLGTVVAAYDGAVIRSQVWQTIGMSTLAAAGIMILSGFVALRMHRHLTHPLDELIATTERISGDADLSARARRISRDEFGRLTDAFNDMLGRIEAQTRELNRRHQEMQQFLYIASHDLKGPLVTITGFVGLVREDIAQQQYDQVDNSLQHMERAAQRMNRLLDDLLELSRIGRVHVDYQIVDVSALAADVAADYTPRAAAVGAVIIVEPNMPQAVADPVRLRQVFENLLGNSLKYGLSENARTIEIGGFPDGEEVRFFVRDHGVGIPTEYHARVFALFQRLNYSSDGAGVGLTVVSKIVESHGGRIWIENTPGGGATFVFALLAPSSPASALLIGKEPAND